MIIFYPYFNVTIFPCRYADNQTSFSNIVHLIVAIHLFLRLKHTSYVLYILLIVFHSLFFEYNKISFQNLYVILGGEALDQCLY